MFEGFTEEYHQADGARLFLRRGGNPNKPPLLCLHGYPQTSAMWHLMAPLLAEDWQLIIPDLRGYGRSEKVADTADHAAYAKRAMGRDMFALMSGLGHARFSILSHDRGARVAHRMGMDQPSRIKAMTILDIAPTREMYQQTSMGFATAYWHWFFLIQAAPLPEHQIMADPDAFWRHKCSHQVRKQTGKEMPFTTEALTEYLTAFRDPAAVHAMCEDYRAAASIDIMHDDADGTRKLEMPIQVLWAENGAIERYFDALALWGMRASDLRGQSVPASHYMAEEIPEMLADLIQPFLQAHLT